MSGLILSHDMNPGTLPRLAYGRFGMISTAVPKPDRASLPAAGMLSIQHEQQQQQQQQQFPHLGQASLTSALSSSPSSASNGTTFGYALPTGHGTSPRGSRTISMQCPHSTRAMQPEHVSWNAHQQAGARQGAGMYSVPCIEQYFGHICSSWLVPWHGSHAGLALPGGSFGLQYNQPSYQHQDQPQQQQQQQQLSYGQQHVYQQQQQQQQTPQFCHGYEYEHLMASQPADGAIAARVEHPPRL